ncbi:MAG: cystathionine gamma-synthase [Gemmatimonadetes bacterium]|nr:cystathionine gamma-synthase [Gemmatimonadota bacterium]MCA9767727.1 cystathionine gamma-synthase [Gemmatimonadota bacterium]HPF62806.1 cystathionine gamma-synthase [Gemmatimonadales bacterium]HRX17967.1 cystathionine gamma-synthase [Gemmatimonadales bacterium]
MTRLDPDPRPHRLATVAVHAGPEPDPVAGAVMPPIYQTSTYIQDALGQPHNGYEYARTRNPTREALERALAALEGGSHGFAFASGLAALDTVLKLLKAGDHVVAGANLYGGSHRLMEQVFRPFGVAFDFIEMADASALEGALRPETRLVYVETPTNPMMQLTDLQSVADLCQARGLLLVVDNTFATPVLQRPLEFGADLVLHSTTKYLNGHSDMVGGALVTSRDDLAERIGFLQNAAGGVPGPFDSWLALRGIKTLTLRMRQHSAGAQQIAAWLEGRRDIPRVYYPGLASHPQHALATRQMAAPGGMLSVELGDVERARRVVERVRLFALAESLGGVESLIGHPASMTHASVPLPMRQAMGLTDSLIRLSVGIEDPDDLIEDLDQALAGT